MTSERSHTPRGSPGFTATDVPPLTDGTLVVLEGRRILDPAGAPLAELGEDDRWRTSDGMLCHGLALPAPRAIPQVHAADLTAARRAADAAWMQSAVEAIEQLALTRDTITSDDVWTEIAMPPREPRMIGNALSCARGMGLIEPTEEHRPSERKNSNHSRPVKVWRCVARSQTRLC